MATPRQIPGLEALLLGLNEDDIAILQRSLDYFDQGYRTLMDHLKELGATPACYRQVNAAIKLVMGKSRSDVSLWDPNEMETWGDGYTYSRKRMQEIDQAAQAARTGFAQALKDRDHDEDD